MQVIFNGSISEIKAEIAAFMGGVAEVVVAEPVAEIKQPAPEVKRTRKTEPKPEPVAAVEEPVVDVPLTASKMEKKSSKVDAASTLADIQKLTAKMDELGGDYRSIRDGLGFDSLKKLAEDQEKAAEYLQKVQLWLKNNESKDLD